MSRIFCHFLCALVIALALVPGAIAHANEPHIVGVKASRNADSSWRFDVSVRHDDEGWDHYADRWEIVAPDGKVLAVRVLAHPHDNEQPFTRSLYNVALPDDTRTITLRAHDKVHGMGPAVTLDLATGDLKEP